MKIVPLLILLVLAFSSCSEPQVEKRVYTEKDIEGYWATYPTLHPSVLAEQIAIGNDSINEPFLRLFNDVNGFPDTTFKVIGDSVFITERQDLFYNGKPEFNLKYRIKSISNEKLELWELQTGQFITYYSLETLPENESELNKLEVNPFLGSGFIWTRDSLYSIYHEFKFSGCYFGVRPTLDTTSSDENFARINQLYKRINMKTLHLEAPNQKDFPPAIGGMCLNFVGSKRIDYLPAPRQSVDPCVRAISAECDAIRSVLNQ